MPQQLTAALVVDPNDKIEVAEAIRDALQMGHQERVARWQSIASDTAFFIVALLRFQEPLLNESVNFCFV